MERTGRRGRGWACAEVSSPVLGSLAAVDAERPQAPPAAIREQRARTKGAREDEHGAQPEEESEYEDRKRFSARSHREDAQHAAGQRAGKRAGGKDHGGLEVGLGEHVSHGEVDEVEELAKENDERGGRGCFWVKKKKKKNGHIAGGSG